MIEIFKKNKTIGHLFLAISIYFPTIAFVPVSCYLLVIPAIIIISRQNGFSVKHILTPLIELSRLKKIVVLSILIIALILRISDIYQNNLLTTSLYSPVFLLPILIIAAPFILNQKVFKFLIGFALIEVLIAILEYVYGVSTFLTELTAYRAFESYDLLYYTRVFGLSGNSSGLAIKLMITLLLIPKCNFNNKSYILLSIGLIIGLILTFNRTVLPVLAIYLIATPIQLYLKKSSLFRPQIVLSIILLSIPFINLEESTNQFTRNHTIQTNSRLKKTKQKTDLDLDKIEMSGRQEIWAAFIDFVLENPITGNYAQKLKIENYHAHNSFLAHLAANGIIIFLLYAVFILIHVNSGNIDILIFIGLIGLGQFVIFWGLSYSDFIFFSFVLAKQPIIYENQSGIDT